MTNVLTYVPSLLLIHNDIAILTIQQLLRFDSYIRPTCLPTSHSPVLTGAAG
jgi:hypothetical protein